MAPHPPSANETLTPQMMGIFQAQEATSLRPMGIAVAIAVFTLLFIFVSVTVLYFVLRRRMEQQQDGEGFAPTTPHVQRSPRASLFPLSLPTLRSKPAISTFSSQEHILATTYPLSKALSETTTLTTNSAKDSKFSTFSRGSSIDEGSLVQMPLPPPPSYKEISLTGPVRSVSGSSWVTEGPTTVEEPLPRVQVGHRGFRAVTRAVGKGATRRI